MNLIHSVNVVHTSTDQDSRNRTDRRREERQARFLLAARRLVTAEGIDALTVPRLARELDCAVGSLYRSFPSKGALIAELQREAAEAITQRFREVRAVVDERAVGFDDASATALRLVCLGDYILAIATVMPEQFGLLRLLISDPRGVVPDEEAYRAEPATVALFVEVFRLFEDAMAAGALDDTSEATTRTIVWLAALPQVVQIGKLARFDADLFDTTVLAHEGARALLAGWGADAALLAHCRQLADDIDVVELTRTLTDTDTDTGPN